MLQDDGFDDWLDDDNDAGMRSPDDSMSHTSSNMDTFTDDWEDDRQRFGGPGNVRSTSGSPALV